MKTAKEMLIENNCCYQETSWGIWIDLDADSEDINGNKRLLMIDKKTKTIIWQHDDKKVEVNYKVIYAIGKLIEELGWDKEV